jgi:hypothetical protein
MSFLKQALKYVPKITRAVADVKPVETSNYKSYKCKVKFAMIGGVGKGKSTIAAAIVLTIQNLSALDPNFFADVLPQSSHILSDANNLRMGKFPEKTNPDEPNSPEAGIVICQKGNFGNKGTQMPICDYAGELTDYIEAKSSGFTPREQLHEMAQSINMDMYNTAKKCQGIIVTLSAEDSLLFSEGPQDRDQDVYTHNALAAMFEYRRQNHLPEPYVIVILTKWDRVQNQSKMIGMDVYDEDGERNGLAQFIDNGYPSTAMLLKALKDKGRVKYFRSWFTLQTDADGKIEYWKDTIKPKIKIISTPGDWLKFKPAYAEEDAIGLVRYIGSFGE